MGTGEALLGPGAGWNGGPSVHPTRPERRASAAPMHEEPGREGECPDKASSTTNQKGRRPSGPQALYDVLYRSAKQDPERRFHALYDKVARSDMLARAWADVAANRGAPGVDGVTIADIRAGGAEAVGSFLEGIAEQLRAHIYRPAPLRRVHIPKPGKPGQARPLGIPTVPA